MALSRLVCLLRLLQHQRPLRQVPRLRPSSRKQKKQQRQPQLPKPRQRQRQKLRPRLRPLRPLQPRLPRRLLHRLHRHRLRRPQLLALLRFAEPPLRQQEPQQRQQLLLPQLLLQLLLKLHLPRLRGLSLQLVWLLRPHRLQWRLCLSPQ